MIFCIIVANYSLYESGYYWQVVSYAHTFPLVRKQEINCINWPTHILCFISISSVLGGIMTSTSGRMRSFQESWTRGEGTLLKCFVSVTNSRLNKHWAFPAWWLMCLLGDQKYLNQGSEVLKLIYSSIIKTVILTCARWSSPRNSIPLIVKIKKTSRTRLKLFRVRQKPGRRYYLQWSQQSE